MVKDDTNRFSGNPLWGDGWGWSFFEAGAPDEPVTQDYQAECLACHEPARDTDLVYVRGYPVLAGKGRRRPPRMATIPINEKPPSKTPRSLPSIYRPHDTLSERSEEHPSEL